MALTAMSSQSQGAASVIVQLKALFEILGGQLRNEAKLMTGQDLSKDFELQWPLEQEEES